MQQTKISFEENQIRFINKYEELGFKDKSSLVRTAIEEYIKIKRKQELVESANLYNKIYHDDPDLQDLTNSATEDWPE